MSIDSTAIAADVQRLAPGNIVDLYELDATEFGASQIYYFTANTDEGGNVTFNGVEYVPLDFEIEDLEWSTTGQIPEAKIKLSNVNNAIGAAVNDFGDLVGAKLTRRRTFEKYLDGRPGANPSAQFEPDEFIIEQKTAHNKNYIEFKLVPFYDLTGDRYPNRQILRDSCPFVYRFYSEDSSSFIYTYVVGCPYTGSNYFDESGDVVVDPVDDKCGKQLSDCTLRFTGTKTPIPFGGFPNVAKIRIR